MTLEEFLAAQKIVDEWAICTRCQRVCRKETLQTKINIDGGKFKTLYFHNTCPKQLAFVEASPNEQES